MFLQVGRCERFLIEHIAEAADPWVDSSWAIAHAGGSGRPVRATVPGWQRSRTRVVVVIEPERQSVGVR